jgi:hypothetical protein
VTMSLLQAQTKYGVINNGAWGAESKNCSIYSVPEDISATWINTATGKPCTRIYCLTDMHSALDTVFYLLRKRGLISELKTFDGCKNIRSVRGDPNCISAHAYGGALDINAATNALGTMGDMSQGLAACFTDAGFVHGRTFKRCDPMHMSFLGW